ncbi:MAG TPA: hypothetical protein VL463_14070 [Kofleriaceae bacterium]|nr:hypothetical protein [Kofleriaceae bacterium]
MRGALIAILLYAGNAAAHPPPPYDCCPKPPSHVTVNEIGPWIVFDMIGGYSGIGIGGRYAVDLVRDRMVYSAEAGLAKLWLTTKDGDTLDRSIPGVMGRVGVNARWIFGEAGHDDFMVDGWLQGGVGVHTIQWLDGGRLAHPDVQIGIGLSEVFGRSRRFSFDAGILFVFGRTDMHGMPTCAGPCDEPTPPVSTELGLIDHCAFTMRW